MQNKYKLPQKHIHLLNQWVELPSLDAKKEVELNKLLDAIPDLKSYKEDSQKTSALLREYLPTGEDGADVPMANVFERNLNTKIDELSNNKGKSQAKKTSQETQEKTKHKPKGLMDKFLAFLQEPQVLTFAYALLAIMLVLFVFNNFKKNQNGSTIENLVIHAHSPQKDVKVRSINSIDRNAALLMLDGLDNLPIDFKLEPYQSNSNIRNFKRAQNNIEKIIKNNEIKQVKKNGQNSNAYKESGKKTKQTQEPQKEHKQYKQSELLKKILNHNTKGIL